MLLESLILECTTNMEAVPPCIYKPIDGSIYSLVTLGLLCLTTITDFVVDAVYAVVNLYIVLYGQNFYH